MNKEIFVQNVKFICESMGIKPTVACRESGAGKDFINQIVTRGQTPSVEKVQLLAQYLGVTTSELLGETLADRNEQRLSAAEIDMVLAYRNAAADDRLIVDAALRKYKKGTTSATG